MAGVTTAHFAYNLSLRAPLLLASGWMHERTGYLVRISDAAGREGWGEASPLPGFSEEDLEAAARALATPSATPPPSVRFALELAALNLMAASTGVAPAVQMNPDAADSVAVNALVTDASEALAAVRAGHACLKLKVGRTAVEADAARIRSVRDRVGPEIRLRLDANRGWTVDEGLRFAKAIEGVGIDYVEEPLTAGSDLRAFAAESGLSVALDESLLALRPKELSAHRYAVAVIVKPTLLGGLRAARAFGEAAKRAGMRVVVSSTFETGVGLRGLAALAAALKPGPGEEAGLDTATAFERDLTDPPFAVRRGRITGLRTLDSYRVRREALR